MRLYPTPARRDLADQIDAGRVFRDAAGVDYIAGERRVTADMAEIEAAGWVELLAGRGLRTWALTPYGKAIQAVRVLDFGDRLVAECGGEDEPRDLGDALKAGVGRTWLLTVGTTQTAARNKHAAREDLRHQAATVLAAELHRPGRTEAMTTPVLAWHGDPQLKAAAVELMREHRRLDDLVQGSYAEYDSNADRGYRGCFHGCLTTEALAKQRNETVEDLLTMGDRHAIDWHDETERIFGIPREVGKLLDRLFESLPPSDCGAFAVATVEAIPPGADLTRVIDHLAYDILTDSESGAPAMLQPGSEAAKLLADVAALFKRRIDGDEPARAEWEDAAGRARELAAETDRYTWAGDAVAFVRAVTTQGGSVSPDDIDEEGAAACHGDAIEWLAAQTIQHLAEAPVRGEV